MKQYKLVNNLVGWLAFVIAAFTYCMTIEPPSQFLGLSGVHHHRL